MVGAAARVVAVVVEVEVEVVALEQELEREQEQEDLVREHLPQCKLFLTIHSVWRRIGHDLHLRRSCWSADGRR